MVGTLIDTLTDSTWRRRAHGTGWRGSIRAARVAYRVHAAENRSDKDIAAIAAALSRLSPRRLALIGVRHDWLLTDVTTLIERAREARQERDEILALADGSHTDGQAEMDGLYPRQVHHCDISASRQAA